ncbi:hypothetical protein D3C81_1101090 [compost metagenome]
MEFAAHCHGEVPVGQGVKQAGYLAEVVIAGAHHHIQCAHHLQEVMLKAAFVTALGEVTGRRGSAQAFDLGIDGGQVLLDGGHGVGDDTLLAGQHRHVRRKVAHRIALGDADDLVVHLDVAGDQRVGFGNHHAVVAREGARVDVMTDDAGIVLARHFVLRGDHRTQLFLHALHAGQQLAGFIAAGGVDGVVHAAAGNGVGHGRGIAQRQHDAVADDPAQAEHQQHQNATRGRHGEGELHSLCLHVIHVHAAGDHPVPGRV